MEKTKVKIGTPRRVGTKWIVEQVITGSFGEFKSPLLCDTRAKARQVQRTLKEALANTNVGATLEFFGLV